MSGHKRMPRWPLFIIGAPAAVAVWAGWVGLGGMCGFGIVHPLPGIADGFTINTAITLPVGVEAYGAYALGAWLTPGTSERARRFAKVSATGALALGMLGQVVYHLLAAAHATRAPWPVVTMVSCLPVVALALGTALAHLLRDPGEAESVAETIPAPASDAETVAAPVTPDVPGSVPGNVAVTAPGIQPETEPGTEVYPVPVRAVGTVAPRRAPKRAPARKAASPEKVFSAELAAGQLPSLRAIKAKMRCGTDRARTIRDSLAEVSQEVPDAA